MKLSPLIYERPSAVDDATQMLGSMSAATPLAGGQSLIPALRLKERHARVLVDLGGLRELRGIELTRDELVIGAGEPMSALERSPLLAAHTPLLVRVLRSVGAVGIRSRATLGGSLAWADPTSQVPASLVALDARVRTTRRTIAVDDLLTGRHRTVLEAGELIRQVILPAAPGRGAFHQVRRTHITWPAVGAVAAYRPDGWRLAVYGVAPRPLLLNPEDGDPHAALMARMEPFDDERVSASYRRQVAPVLARRALRELAEQT